MTTAALTTPFICLCFAAALGCSSDDAAGARTLGGGTLATSGGVGSSGGTALDSGGSTSPGSGGLPLSGGFLQTSGGTSQPSQCDDGLVIILRDFTEAHPDFESFTFAQTGLVQPQLGADKKPVYAHPGATSATTGPAEFDQWYRDVEGVNMRFEQRIAFTESAPGLFVYDSNAFFPLDNMGFGNGPGLLGLPIGPDHNFLFTTEAHTLFTYHGGEVFTFRGDDDLWVFINGRLAVDLGGTHQALTQTIALDAMASQLEITVGQTYPMDIFHAERHTVESNFRIETTIDLSCIENVDLQ